jgi:hypothetical protein
MLVRFWTKVDDRGGPTACWLWRGARTGAGYGALQVAVLRTGRRMDLAHRIAYELYHREPIPAGMTIDHLCRVRHCVNPHHLEVVSRGENVLRGEGRPARNARATMCVWGHPFDAETIYRTPRGARACIICHRARNRVTMARWAACHRAPAHAH